MFQDRVALVAQLLEMSHRPDHPVVLVPIDASGTACGPPEVRYSPPAGTALN